MAFAAVDLRAPTVSLLGDLGDAIRSAGSAGWTAALAEGDAVTRETLDTALGGGGADALVDAGLARTSPDGRIELAVVVVGFGGVLTAVPKRGWSDETVYLGADSALLIEAALRLAPAGHRAADLGTGTGLLAAILAERFRVVAATDLDPSVAGAARITLALNRRPPAHAAGAFVTDVASGLRPGVFDLVTANAPWVPLAPDLDAPRELFAHGGDTGVELPARFVREAADLLAPGGVGLLLALDVLDDGRRPLRQRCDELRRAGYVTAVLPTPLHRQWPHLDEVIRHRQPALADATHVAVLVARPRPPDDTCDALLVAAAALARRWSSTTPEPSRQPPGPVAERGRNVGLSGGIC